MRVYVGVEILLCQHGINVCFVCGVSHASVLGSVVRTCAVVHCDTVVEAVCCVDAIGCSSTDCHGVGPHPTEPRVHRHPVPRADQPHGAVEQLCFAAHGLSHQGQAARVVSWPRSFYVVLLYIGVAAATVAAPPTVDRAFWS